MPSFLEKRVILYAETPEGAKHALGIALRTLDEMDDNGRAPVRHNPMLWTHQEDIRPSFLSYATPTSVIVKQLPEDE